jgi:hypothetical protein
MGLPADPLNMPKRPPILGRLFGRELLRVVLAVALAAVVAYVAYLAYLKVAEVLTD